MQQANQIVRRDVAEAGLRKLKALIDYDNLEGALAFNAEFARATPLPEGIVDWIVAQFAAAWSASEAATAREAWTQRERLASLSERLAEVKPKPKPATETAKSAIALPTPPAGRSVSRLDLRKKFRRPQAQVKTPAPSLVPSEMLADLIAEADANEAAGIEYQHHEVEPPKIEPPAATPIPATPKAAAADDEVAEELDIFDRPIGPREAKPALYLPGVAGEIQDYYLRTAMQPSEIMSLAPALMVPTALVCGNVIGPSGPKGCSLHRYLILLGPTSSGKQAIIDLTKECLDEAGVKTMIGPNRFKSGPGLVRYVAENPTSICVQDEFGKLLAKIGNEKANQSELEINERMREMWGQGPGSIYNGPVGAGKEDNMIAIAEPHLNILGVGVREEFYSVCRVTDQVNGFLNRLDLLEETRMIRPRDVGQAQFPFNLKTALTKLSSIKRKRLPWTNGAKDIWEAEKDRVYYETDERKIKLWARTPEKIVKAAAVFACCRFAKVVEREDMEIAQRFLRESDKVFKQGIDEAERRRLLDYAELKREIERRTVTEFNNEATLFEIKRSFRHNTKFKHAVDDAVTDMVDSGVLCKERVRASNHKFKDVYHVVDQS